jgi:hypothetical protein
MSNQVRKFVIGLCYSNLDCGNEVSVQTVSAEDIDHAILLAQYQTAEDYEGAFIHGGELLSDGCVYAEDDDHPDHLESLGFIAVFVFDGAEMVARNFDLQQIDIWGRLR